MSTLVETDVLIVGSGPAGASAALALSTYGVPNIVVTRYARLADTPRAAHHQPAHHGGAARPRRALRTILGHA